MCDWLISCNCYWGLLIFVWKSDDFEYLCVDIYGLLEELECDFGMFLCNFEGEVDLYCLYIDDFIWLNFDDFMGKSIMCWIEDVFDVWFDLGLMLYV